MKRFAVACIAASGGINVVGKLTGSFSSVSILMEYLVNLHLVERFTRVGPDVIKYEVTLDDPTT